MTYHAAERMRDRLACLDPASRDMAETMAETYAAEHPTGSHAVRVAVLQARVGTPWGADSNGDTVWAIVRDGAVVTYMFRRRTQPAERAALRVDRVALAV